MAADGKQVACAGVLLRRQSAYREIGAAGLMRGTLLGKPGRQTAELPHSTGGTRLHEADGVQVAKYVCRAQRAVPLREKALGARTKRIDGRREIPRPRVPALRAKPKARDTPLGMTAPRGDGCDPSRHRAPSRRHGALAAGESPAVQGDGSDGAPKYDGGANGKGACNHRAVSSFRCERSRRA